MESLTVFDGDINIGFLGQKRKIDHTLGGIHRERFDDLPGHSLHKSLLVKNVVTGEFQT